MFSYVFKTGFKNLGAKKLFSFASIGTIACCVLVYCISICLASNFESMIKKVERTIGIQVFFDEELSEDDIQRLAEDNFVKPYVSSMKFISSGEAWDKFKIEYFDNKAELAAAFEDDNPLVHSSSYEILLNDINKQYEYVNYLKEIKGVRQINYSHVLIDSLISINFGINVFSITLISLLLLIAIILISNTISLVSKFREKENEIMRLIGATNFMIRAPFVIEGMFMGLIGSIIPNAIICSSYNYLMNLFVSKAKFLTHIFTPVKLINLTVPMTVYSILISVLICMLVSFTTVRKHLKV